MPRVPLWSLGLACLWGGLASAAPAVGTGAPPAQKRQAAPAAAPASLSASTRAPAPAAPQALAPPVASPERKAAEDPATASQRHFEAGRELVDAGKLNEGLRELIAAYAGTPNPPPETDFYLGMAYDGLARTDPAILAYRRYLARSPGSINARNVRERLTVLLQRRGENAPPLPEVEAAPPPPRPGAKGPFPPLRVESPPPAPTTPPRTH